MAEVQFVDTTLRDGQQSLWAMNMRTADMLPALRHLDRAGFDQIELMAPGAAFKKFVRHLKENPWDWVTSAAATVRETPLRWHGAFDGWTMSGHIPAAVGELMISKVVARGIHFTRIGDNWNRMALLQDKKRRLEQAGMTPVVHLMYSVSPRHTDDYFVDRARQAAALRPYRLCLKDVGGLLTPERTRALVPKLLEATGDIPWEFHGHCNNGLGPLNALAAVEAGVQFLHTAVPPLANGSSQPSITNVAHNLRELGHTATIHLSALEPATEHLLAVARRHDFPLGIPHTYQESLYQHQIPGGMISNLEHQLQLAGLGHSLPEVLREAAHVRADFGYPIMVTPLSQFVGSQAAINVLVGERYKQVSDDVIHYAWGRHGGSEATEGMDREVRAKILDRPRAKQLEHHEPAEPTLRELRRRFGEQTSDEDLILRTIVGDDAVEHVRASATAETGSAQDGSPVSLLRGLWSGPTLRYVSLTRPGAAVTVQRGPGPRP